MLNIQMNNFKQGLVPGMEIYIRCKIVKQGTFCERRNVRYKYTIKEVYSHHCICEAEDGTLESLTIQEIAYQKKL